MPNRARFRTTWDGLFISEEPPHGATVIVRRRDGGTAEYLLLHRADATTNGDWAWGPPAGVRLPGEDVEASARRALEETTGLRLLLRPIAGDPAWAAYWAEAPRDASIVLTEHDRHEWVHLDEAMRRCRPTIVAEQFEQLAAVAAA